MVQRIKMQKSEQYDLFNYYYFHLEPYFVNMLVGSSDYTIIALSLYQWV